VHDTKSQHRGGRRTRALLAGGLGIAVLAGGYATHGSVAVQAKSGGILTMARSTDIFTFDPYATQDDNSIFTEATIYDGLVRLAPDGRTIQAALATKWKVSPNGKTARFTLRKGVRFSNGTPLTSKDVAFSLKRDADPKGSWGFLFAPVTNVTADGPSTVTIHMKTAFAPLLPALTTFAASIYSKANFDKFGKAFGQHPLGTGPFALKKWTKGISLELRRNPYYWEAGKPHLDGIKFTVVGDDNSKILQLQSGQVDVIDKVPPNLLSKLRASAQVKVQEINGTAVGWITINEKIKPLSDKNVRLALAWAVDRQGISKSVYFGAARPARSIMPSSTLFYNPNAGAIGYSLAKARQYLAKSRFKHGFKVQIMIPAGDASAQGIATIWADSLKKIGINAKLQQVEATTAQDRYNSEKYQIWISQWTNDTPDPDEFAGAGLDYTAGQNSLHTSFKNKQVVLLVHHGRQELNPVKRAKIYTQIQRMVNQFAPFIYTVESPRLYATTSKVRNFLPNSQGKYTFQNVSK